MDARMERLSTSKIKLVGLFVAGYVLGTLSTFAVRQRLSSHPDGLELTYTLAMQAMTASNADQLVRQAGFEGRPPGQGSEAELWYSRPVFGEPFQRDVLYIKLQKDGKVLQSHTFRIPVAF